MSASAAHTVNQAATTTAIATHTPDPSPRGSAVSVTWTVTPTAPGAGTPTGNVTVGDGVNTCVAAVGLGGCSVTLNTVGVRPLTASYVGDANFVGSGSTVVNHTVTLAATTTAITSDLPDPSVTGQVVTVVYTVTGREVRPPATSRWPIVWAGVAWARSRPERAPRRRPPSRPTLLIPR